MSDALPFSPASETLKYILRERFIKSACRWLLGEDANSVLAQAPGSAWEAAMTVLFLLETARIFEEAGGEAELPLPYFELELHSPCKNLRLARNMRSQSSWASTGYRNPPERTKCESGRRM